VPEHADASPELAASAPHAGAADGIFVVGADAEATDLVGRVVGHLGARTLTADGLALSEALDDFNDALLERLGGRPGASIEVAPIEAARLLLGQAAHAAERFSTSFGPPRVSPGGTSWVWADKRLSFLAPFWAQALDISAAVVLVHSDPATVAARARDDEERAVELERWARYNTAAMASAAMFPTIVVGLDRLAARTETTILELSKFLEECGLNAGGTVAQASAEVLRAHIDRRPRVDASVIDPNLRTLAGILAELDGQRIDRDPGALPNLPDVLETVSTFYDERYYAESYDQSGVPYRRGEKAWEDFFSLVAQSIVDSIAPKTVFDAGCASGMLVEALRRRGVDASGIDISAWAISQVPHELRSFCHVGSITDEITGHYDLITCTEVMEHLPAWLAPAAVGNLCRHADAVLFSSTPDDFDEPSHLNVEPGSYWAVLFLHEGFIRDVDVDVNFVGSHAVLFRRRAVDVEGLVSEYERGFVRLETALTEHQALTAGLAAVNDERARLAREITEARAAIGDMDRRRIAETRAAFDTVRSYEAENSRLAGMLGRRDDEIAAIHATRTFRYTARLRRIYGLLRRRRVRPDAVHAAADAPPDVGTYDLWVRQYDTLDDATRQAIAARLARLEHPPLISLIMPVYNTPDQFLRAAVDSIRNQIYSHWELCIADDCSTEPHVGQILDEMAAADARIRVVRRSENGHISATSNSALEMATGDYVACVDHDDVLPEHALALSAIELAAHPDAGILYSDEDKLDHAGRRCDPFFKPDYDPLLLMGQNYVCHLCIFRRDLVTRVGGYREGFEGSQDWDLVLRVAELVEPAQVRHLPHVLYHWRQHDASTASALAAKPYAAEAGRRAVIEHLDRTGRTGTVTRRPHAGHGFLRVAWDTPDPLPLVSVIIPTRDGHVLRRCLESLLSLTTYPEFEVVVVDNSSRALPTLEFLRAYEGRITVMRDERPFNYPALNNAAVTRTTGDVVCLLNDDTEVISGDWLTEMVSQVVQPEVGAVGAKLYYDDGRIQHGGVVLGIHGVAGHPQRGWDRLSAGYFGHLGVAQNLSAVTAACMVVRRAAWDEVGGLDEVNLPVAFNDVDFCLRLRAAGWRVVWTPYAELFHHESVSRGPDHVGPRAAEFVRETEYMLSHWAGTLSSDPFYNPNLTLVGEDFSLAWPPRVSYR
jgi:GT2 family glycosyltransferase